ncbi:hypothetical protein [uncultured Granulicatella sp.]|uniref:hypothetical protein n=1 Tax=uncultured Granulicatella sp. TaxID=316089 RepID=UPI0028D069EB|nr:hypothetical protein [uncultured Granulicatella sp.]
MKKIITVLLGMLVLTLGSSSVLAMESENMASDIGQSEFESLVTKSEERLNQLFLSSDIQWEKAVKVYEQASFFESVPQVDDVRLKEELKKTEYYWVVPTSHRQPKVEIRFDIVKDFDREEAKKSVANGLMTAESVAEQEKQIGKWDITSVGEYEEGVEPFAQIIEKVLKEQSINPKAIYYIQPTKVMMDPIVLVKLSDNEYRILIHSLPFEENQMKSKAGILKFDTLYPYETAQKVLATYLNEKYIERTGRNSAPEPSGVIFVEHFRAMMIVGVVFVMIVGFICWKIFKRRH